MSILEKFGILPINQLEEFAKMTIDYMGARDVPVPSIGFDFVGIKKFGYYKPGSNRIVLCPFNILYDTFLVQDKGLDFTLEEKNAVAVAHETAHYVQDKWGKLPKINGVGFRWARIAIRDLKNKKKYFLLPWEFEANVVAVEVVNEIRLRKNKPTLRFKYIYG